LDRGAIHDIDFSNDPKMVHLGAGPDDVGQVALAFFVQSVSVALGKNLRETTDCSKRGVEVMRHRIRKLPQIASLLDHAASRCMILIVR